jgi:hypothetical protein
MQKVIELGAVGLFEKPFDVEKLLGCIDSKFNRMTDLLKVQKHPAVHQPLER